MDIKQHKKASIWIIIAFNIIFISLAVAFIVSYKIGYDKKLYEQNLNDIVNINHSAANISSEFYNSKERKLKDIMRYQELHRLSKNEFLQYIFDTNQSLDTNFQLIDSSGNGIMVTALDNGTHKEVDYTSYDYEELKNIFNNAKIDGNVDFSPEFTDDGTGVKSFAFYAYFELENEDGTEEKYTLMEISRSSHFIGLFDLEGGFDNLSTVIIDEKGNYVLSNADFKSDNLFQYIAMYNNLSLDEMNLIQDEVEEHENGSLTFNNYSNEESVFVYRHIPKLGWYSVSSVPLSSFHRNNSDMNYTVMIIIVFFILMVVDVSWLLTLNNNSKKNAIEAVNANRAKTDFLSNMSHDIRTPINVINGMTELALTEPDDEVVKEYLANIQSSGQFLLGLVNDILDLNKVESGKMELHPKPYSCIEFKRYIDAVITPSCKAKNIDFTIDIECDGSIVVDKLRLNQIMFNLLSNAVKFTPEGGHISLKCLHEEVAENKAKLTFTISDNGIGMSLDFQKKMYEAFSQESRSAESEVVGTGLGLAIVKKIVDLMGGTINVESVQNAGTVFTVGIIVNTCARETVADEVNSEKADISGKRILLCEDHPLNRQIVIRLLEKKSVIVETAVNGKEGLEMYTNSPEHYYDAILMDIRMPVMNGLEATMEIRKSNKNDANTIPVIALTANAYDTDIENCINAGANEHLAKPIDSSLLYDTLAKYCG